MNRIAPISASKASSRRLAQPPQEGRLSSEQEGRGRYPGTRPFSESPEDQQRFFGRNREGEQLYLRVLSVSFLLQFAKSGLGKTSLLQASLFPRLRRKHFLPVMVRFNKDHEGPVDAVARSFQEACEKEQLEVPALRKDGLWELLSAALVWRGDLLMTPVLVLDQFEEVFTVRDRAFRDKLAEELGALATGVPPERLCANEGSEPVARPDVKIVISMREDYLGALEEFSSAIPNLFHERLRLEPLSEDGAREAIMNPAHLLTETGEEPFWAPEFAFEERALDAMIEFLKGDAGVIEPFTLQLLCRRAELIAHGKAGSSKGLVTLTLADFHDGKDFEQVLRRFYQDVLGQLEQRLGVATRANVEELCEHGLLDREGRRLLLEEGQIHDQFGVDDQTLKLLLQQRLVRRERRGESTFYEVSHDRLADSIYASRRNKLPKNEREQRQKEEELIRKRYRNMLLTVTGVFLTAFLTSAGFLISERTTNLATQLRLARSADIPLRDRLLTLVDASTKSDNFGTQFALSVMSHPKVQAADEALRDILVRSPIFAGKTQAALDFEGARLAYLSDVDEPDGKLRRVDLPQAVRDASDLNLMQAISSAASVHVPPGKVVGSKMNFPPTLGFITPVSDKQDSLPASIVVSPSSILTEVSDQLPNTCAGGQEEDRRSTSGRGAKNSLLIVDPNRTVRPLDLALGDMLRGLPFPPQVDFANNSYRVFGWPFKGGLPTELCVLAFRAYQSDLAAPLVASATDSPATAPNAIVLKPEDRVPVRIDWRPVEREARRIPVLASDCDEFAFLGLPVDEQANVIRPKLYAGAFGAFLGDAASRPLDISLQPGNPTSVTISRGCAKAIVRVSPNQTSADEVYLADLHQEGKTVDLGDLIEYEVPLPLKGFLLPSWPLLTSALAGAPLPELHATRVAWLTEKGLAVVDLPDRTKKATPLLKGDDPVKGDDPLKGDGQLFLTSFPNSQSNSRLVISKDGNFLLALSQKSFSAVPDFRLFDLRVEERRALLERLSGAQLRTLACQVVGFMTTSNSSGEATALLGDPKQICE